MRVLLAEADVAAARDLFLALKSPGVMIDHTDLGEDALEMVRHYDYDVVLLSPQLADISGLEVLRRMRHARQATPAFMLGSRISTQAKVAAFGAGADDVLVTPVDPGELLDRLQAVVSRSRGISDPVVRVDGLHVNLNTREVSFEGRAIHVTGKEAAILELLVTRKGQVLTKDMFLNHLYGGMDEPEAKIIDVFICKLRKKLQNAGASNMIGTCWGRGYIFNEAAAKPAVAAAFDGPVVAHTPSMVM